MNLAAPQFLIALKIRRGTPCERSVCTSTSYKCKCVPNDEKRNALLCCEPSDFFLVIATVSTNPCSRKEKEKSPYHKIISWYHPPFYGHFPRKASQNGGFTRYLWRLFPNRQIFSTGGRRSSRQKFHPQEALLRFIMPKGLRWLYIASKCLGFPYI